MGPCQPPNEDDADIPEIAELEPRAHRAEVALSFANSGVEVYSRKTRPHCSPDEDAVSHVVATTVSTAHLSRKAFHSSPEPLRISPFLL